VTGIGGNEKEGGEGRDEKDSTNAQGVGGEAFGGNGDGGVRNRDPRGSSSSHDEVLPSGGSEEGLRSQGNHGSSGSLPNAWNDDVITGPRKENTFEGDFPGLSRGEHKEEPVEEGPRWDPEGGQDFDEFLKDLMEEPVREAPPNGGVRPNPGPDLTDTDVVILEAVEKGDGEEDVRVKTKLARNVWERPWRALLRLGYVGRADGGGYEVKALGQKALEAPRRTRSGARPSGR
jgi:hypothetical protein